MNNQTLPSKEPFKLIQSSNPAMDKAMLTLEEMKSKITGEPRCGRAGCYGRGWTGYDIVPDKYKEFPHIFLHICTCAKPFETEYSRLNKRIDELTQSTQKEMNEKFTELHQREFGWKVKNLWNKIKRQISREF
jgi:hypothetical protein